MVGENMTGVEKIEYAIQSLQLVKDEIKYAQDYDLLPDEEKINSRRPNGTIIREALRMTGRLSYSLANMITLSQYCDEIFKE